MSIRPDQIRARVAAHVVAELVNAPGVVDPWVEASIPYGVPLEVVGLSRDLADRSFVVGIIDTVGLPNDRQVRGEGLRVRTGVGCRAMFRVRADAGASDPVALTNDEDRALREEARLVASLLSVGSSRGNPELALQFVGIARRYVAEGTHLAVDIVCSCVHNYALT